MNKKEPTYVIQWSPTRKHFCIETSKEMFESNRQIFYKGAKTDYLPLTTAKSVVQAVEIIARFEAQNRQNQSASKRRSRPKYTF
jgi:hypothetical protein